jgi:hypothetical protein
MRNIPVSNEACRQARTRAAANQATPRHTISRFSL